MFIDFAPKSNYNFLYIGFYSHLIYRRNPYHKIYFSFVNLKYINSTSLYIEEIQFIQNIFNTNTEDYYVDCRQLEGL